MSQQNAMLDVMLGAAEEGIAAAGTGSPTARRLHEMQDFYAFMAHELPNLIENWRERYQA